MQNSDGCGEVEPPRPTGAGVEVEHAFSFFDLGAMRVAVEDGRESGCDGIKTQRSEIVEEVQKMAFEEQDIGFGQAAAGAGVVDVAANGVKRSDLREGFEDLRFADITEVEDALDTCEGEHNFRAQQTVGVADNPDLHRLVLKI